MLAYDQHVMQQARFSPNQRSIILNTNDIGVLNKQTLSRDQREIGFTVGKRDTRYSFLKTVHTPGGGGTQLQPVFIK